jgi:hypothetical protein
MRLRPKSRRNVLRAKSREMFDAVRQLGMTSETTPGGMATTIHEEMTSIERMHALVSTMKLIIRSKRAVAAAVPSHIAGRPCIKLSSLGLQVVAALKTDLNALAVHFPLHKLNPLVELFAKHALKDQRDSLPQELVALPLQPMPFHLMECMHERFVGRVNRFVADIKLEGNSIAFKRTAKAHERSANKNFKSLIEYIDALFDARARLCVIRIDLHYQAGVAGRITADIAKAHLTRLLRTTHSLVAFDGLVGYAWKMEYGLSRNFHFHMLFFFDGSVKREDVNIAQMIGEHWKNTITEGEGSYWNCNRHKHEYRFLGIGMINHFDAGLRDGLRRIAVYFAKTDYYIQMASPDGGKTFGKGEKPQKSNRGRPRDSLNDDEPNAELETLSDKDID